MDDNLRIYCERDLIPAGVQPTQLLLPFTGNFIGHNGYERFTGEGRRWIDLVSPSDAEIALLPFDGRYLIEAKHGFQAAAIAAGREMVSRASGAGLKTLVLVNADSSAAIPLENVIVLRTSLDRRTRRPFEFALPAWHEDLVTTYSGGETRSRGKCTRPRIGFCGLAASSAPPLTRRVRNALRGVQQVLGSRVTHRDGVFLRQAAMRALNACGGVETEFVVRPSCFHGVEDDEVRTRQRIEYVRNVTNTDYTLCVRGYGNFSFRFFEVMSLGRVPLLIDTHCVLPFDELHDYRSYCIIVPESDLTRAGDYVVQHYAALCDAAFRDLQGRIRRFWVDWLAPESFFRRMSWHWRGGRAQG